MRVVIQSERPTCRDAGDTTRRPKEGDKAMTLILQCPVCTQGLVFQGTEMLLRRTCPVCGAPLRIRPPRLPEPQILHILRGHPAGRT